LAARAATQAARRSGVLIADFVTCAASPSRLGRITQPVLRGVRALGRHLQLSRRPRTRLGGFIKSSGRRTCASRPPSARPQRQRCHRAGCKYLRGQTLTACAACAGSTRTSRSRRSGGSRSSWDLFPRAAVSSAFPAVSRSAVELRTSPLGHIKVKRKDKTTFGIAATCKTQTKSDCKAAKAWPTQQHRHQRLPSATPLRPKLGRLRRHAPPVFWP